VVPATSKTSATRFPHTVLVNPSLKNGLTLPTVFLGFQMQAVDSSWIIQPAIGELDDADLERVEAAVLEAIGLAR
jgi:mRNA-degrading endonuclease toxin of MazEF toxin-antitoxin module